MSDHLIAEASRHVKALGKMSLPKQQPTHRDIEWYIEECIELRKQLDPECASKREHLRIAYEEINGLKVRVGIYDRENAALREKMKVSWDEISVLVNQNAALKAALDHQMTYQRELRADKDRLDWLDKTGCWLTITGQKNFISGSARAVIDGAMGEGK